MEDDFLHRLWRQVLSTAPKRGTHEQDPHQKTSADHVNDHLSSIFLDSCICYTVAVIRLRHGTVILCVSDRSINRIIFDTNCYQPDPARVGSITLTGLVLGTAFRLIVPFHIRFMANDGAPRGSFCQVRFCSSARRRRVSAPLEKPPCSLPPPAERAPLRPSHASKTGSRGNPGFAPGPYSASLRSCRPL
jgi:hypothetical protein